MSFIEPWERIKSRTGLKKLKDLAEFIGVTPAFASKRKSEKIFPVEWAFLIAQKYNLSTDWIMTGEYPKNIKIDFIQDLDTWLIGYSKNEPFRKSWFKGMIYDSFPAFKEWHERKEGKESGNDGLPQINVS